MTKDELHRMVLKAITSGVSINDCKKAFTGYRPLFPSYQDYCGFIESSFTGIRVSRGRGMSKAEIRKVQDETNKVHFESRFIFLQDHCGFRPGEFHLLIAPKGGSKSTLARDIVEEVICQNKKTLVFLSEEKISTWEHMLASAISMDFDDDTASKAMNNLFLMSQLDMHDLVKKLDTFLYHVEREIKDNQIEFVLFDNLTTSFIYTNLPFAQQEQAVSKLKLLASDLNVPMLFLIHTKKDHANYNKMISDEDVRGSQSVSNISSYTYTIQVLHHLRQPRAFLKTEKSRYHNKAHKGVYELFYDKGRSTYINDHRSSYDEYFEALKPESKQGVTKTKGF